MRFLVCRIQNPQQVGGLARPRGVAPAIAGAVALERDNTVKDYFTDKERARDFARFQAENNPKQQWGVFVCDEIFETTQPKVLLKHFNADGELVEKK